VGDSKTITALHQRRRRLLLSGHRAGTALRGACRVPFWLDNGEPEPAIQWAGLALHHKAAKQFDAGRGLLIL
jgi:hypothetical protein